MSRKKIVEQIYTFTTDYPGIASELTTDVYISEAFDSSNPTDSQPQPFSYKAIWDTGAEGTLISERVVQECGLKEITMTRLIGVTGEKWSPVFLVNIILPNRVMIPLVHVAQADFGFDGVLIGMNIITLGDLAISNYTGVTKLSFRFPSVAHLDFGQMIPPYKDDGDTAPRGITTLVDVPSEESSKQKSSSLKK